MKSLSDQKLNKIALGGTFDHFHKGHELLIKTAFKCSKHVLIGITTDDFIKNKKYCEKLETFSTRKSIILNFITEKLKINTSIFEIFPLDDPYGPTISNHEIEGLVCSEETYDNAVKINEIRQKNVLAKLILIVIPLIFDDDNKKISSTHFRELETL